MWFAIVCSLFAFTVGYAIGEEKGKYNAIIRCKIAKNS